MFLESNVVLSPHQFSFRCGKSTADAVRDLMGYLLANLDKKKKILDISLDLTKAFDTVLISTLVKSLNVYGSEVCRFSSS